MFDVVVQYVLDLMLLLRSQDYVEFFNENQLSRKNDYMFIYVLDVMLDKVDVIVWILKKMGLKFCMISGQVFFVGDLLWGKDGDKMVEVWLVSFYNVEFVVMDFFYGVVFLIIFNCLFIVYGNLICGFGRFKFLFCVVGLENWLIVDLEGVDIDVFMQLIDWVLVNDWLDQLCKKLMQFLKNVFLKIDKYIFLFGGGLDNKLLKMDFLQFVLVVVVDMFV